jgi:hypothetical protein
VIESELMSGRSSTPKSIESVRKSQGSLQELSRQPIVYE